MLQHAPGHPSSYLPAVDKVNQWNLALQTNALPGISTEVGRTPPPAPSETSSQGYEATGITDEPSSAASQQSLQAQAITQANLCFEME